MGTFSIEDKNGVTYLVYHKTMDEQIDTVTCNMMERNPIPGLLPFSFWQQDHEWAFFYDIAGCIPFDDLWNNRPMKKSQLIDFLKQVLQIADTCEDYMIHFDEVQFQKVYFDKEHQKVRFVIVPVLSMNTSAQSRLRELVMGIPYDPREDRSYVADMISYFTNHSSFSQKHLQQFIKQLEQKQTKEAITETDYPSFLPSNSPKTVSTPPSVSPKKPQPITERDYSSITQNFGGKVNIPMKIGRFPDTKESSLMNPEDKSGKKIGLLGGIFNKTEKNNKKDSSSEKPKTQEKFAHTTTVKGNPFGDLVIPQTVKDQDIQNGFSMIRQDVPMNNYSAQEVSIGGTVLLNDDFPETDIIEKTSPPPKTMRYSLQRISNGQRFSLNMGANKLGRKNSLVDIYISDNTHIGRIHAIIYIENGQILLQDNQSTNGTFLHSKDHRITSKVSLSVGDHFFLGNEEFVVTED